MHRYFHRSLRHTNLALFALFVSLSQAQAAHAATFTVDRTDDVATATACDDATPNDCSLRGAILAANARPISEASTINVPAGTYVLSHPSSCTYSVQPNPTEFFTSPPYLPLCLSGQVTIQGAGAATTIIDGGGRGRVLFVGASAVADLRGVAIANGLGDRSFGDPRQVTVPNGGGIVNEGTLTLTESVVRNNSLPPGTATNGAGIVNAGVLTLLRSAVSNNNILLPDQNQLGGGIFNEAFATLTVADSTISDNMIGTGGGGIADGGGTVTITGSTISGNHCDGLGGGLFGSGFPSAPSSLTIINSTISGNISGSAGGGIATGNFGDVHLNNVTITNNTGAAGGAGSGGGVAGAITLQNTIIGGNHDAFRNAPDCSATLTSLGYNLIQSTSGCIITGNTTGNLTGVDPKLGVLVNNGGLTQTHALSDGSPAIDAGNPAAPGSGGAACAVSDQRGFLRPLGTLCDIGAFERSRAFSLAKVLPNTGGNTGSVSAIVAGNGFVDGTTVKLTRAGQADVIGTPANVDVGGSAIAATFDLIGRPIGTWDVVVRNPDGTSKTLPGGFTTEAGRAADLWVNVIGVLRRHGVSRFIIFYGNRGNVDAIGVPLSLSVPVGYVPSRVFAITPPPPQPGQVRDDWSQVPVTVLTEAPGGFVNIPLLLPVVPAGFAGLLQIGLTVPPGTPDSLLLVGIGDPLFAPDLDPGVVSDAVASTQAYLQNAGVTVPPALVPDLAQYVTNQFRQVVESGRTAFDTSLGTQVQVYSLSQLHFDLVLFGAARVAATQASTKPDAPSDWLSATYRSFVSLVLQLAPAEAQAQQQNCPVYKKGDILQPGCSGGGGPEEPFLPPAIPIPPGCDLKNPSTFGKCKPTEDHCDALPGYKIERNDKGSFCVPTKPSKGCSKLVANPVGSNAGCTIFPLLPRNSIDPNGKVGTLGVTPAQFLLSATPLSYTINFENLETATAAAQEVLITDQLDINTMDLDTFSLGPISFGRDITLVPAPGVQQFTGGVDLRPAQNLLVTVQASVDTNTGVLTWRFTSIDPGTGQLTEDPDAGFLPPNKTPPEGDGSVAFTVQAKNRLASGTRICNEASIVFDTNAPIRTPQWCNSIDQSPPTSQVSTLAAAQTAASFPVQWSGTDSGSGIADYTIFVSENSGPFAPFVSETTDMSAVFAGQTGKTYAFYSVARDLVGNVESPHGEPDTQTIVPGTCAGDCDGNDTVDIGELIRLVDIALGRTDSSTCPGGVPSGTEIDITLIIRAVNNALSECTR